MSDLDLVSRVNEPVDTGRRDFLRMIGAAALASPLIGIFTSCASPIVPSNVPLNAPSSDPSNLPSNVPSNAPSTIIRGGYEWEEVGGTLAAVMTPDEAINFLKNHAINSSTEDAFFYAPPGIYPGPDKKERPGFLFDVGSHEEKSSAQVDRELCLRVMSSFGAGEYWVVHNHPVDPVEYFETLQKLKGALEENILKNREIYGLLVEQYEQIRQQKEQLNDLVGSLRQQREQVKDLLDQGKEFPGGYGLLDQIDEQIAKLGEQSGNLDEIEEPSLDISMEEYELAKTEKHLKFYRTQGLEGILPSMEMALPSKIDFLGARINDDIIRSLAADDTSLANDTRIINMVFYNGGYYRLEFNNFDSPLAELAQRYKAFQTAFFSDAPDSKVTSRDEADRYFREKAGSLADIGVSLTHHWYN